jgi:2-amino-4-hydroxy-6-hydroxymethyldihydropteridine diphosphokinase
MSLPPGTVRVAIALGSNLGDRAGTLGAAVDAVATRIGPVAAVSALYETAPVGGPDQGDYLNAVVVVDTVLDARGVLDGLLAIEREHGRERGHRWGPRTLDLDLILYGSETIDRPGLSVPHPELRRRRFVLEPLVEAWPDARLPDGTAVADLLPAVADQEVRRWEPGGAAIPAMVFLTVGLVAVAIWLLIDALL